MWNCHQLITYAFLPHVIHLRSRRTVQLETITAKILSCSNDLATGKPSGSHGTISNQTKPLVNMISKKLNALEALGKQHNPTYTIDSGWKPSRFWSFRQTVRHLLKYARKLVNAIRENTNHVVLCMGGLQRDSWQVILPSDASGYFIKYHSDAGKSKAT